MYIVLWDVQLVRRVKEAQREEDLLRGQLPRRPGELRVIHVGEERN